MITSLPPHTGHLGVNNSTTATAAPMIVAIAANAPSQPLFPIIWMPPYHTGMIYYYLKRILPV